MRTFLLSNYRLDNYSYVFKPRACDDGSRAHDNGPRAYDNRPKVATMDQGHGMMDHGQVTMELRV